MPTKLIRICAFLSYFAAKSALLFAREKDPMRRAPSLLRHFQLSCQRTLKILNLKTKILGNRHLLDEGKAYLVLGNHSSYLDMVVLCAHYPAFFVSSVERRDDGVLGLLSKMAGTIFVDRINKSKLHSDINTIVQYLEAGAPICLYPEGTTNNGRAILPFKSSLLRAIEGKATAILPVCVRYTQMNGEPVTTENIDKIAWHGDMDFLPHFKNLTSQQSFAAELIVLDPIHTTAEMGRKEIAQLAFEKISAAYGRSKQA